MKTTRKIIVDKCSNCPFSRSDGRHHNCTLERNERAAALADYI